MAKTTVKIADLAQLSRPVDISEDEQIMVRALSLREMVTLFLSHGRCSFRCTRRVLRASWLLNSWDHSSCQPRQWSPILLPWPLMNPRPLP